MAKPKTIYVCSACGGQTQQWVGRCPHCHEWNTLGEERPININQNARRASYAGEQGQQQAVLLEQVPELSLSRFPTTFSEFDRVLGGGLVVGSIVMVGGDPGIGKSTLLLQTLCQLSQEVPALYVTGEESLQQVRLRAQRLELPIDRLQVLAATELEHILKVAQKLRPQVIVIDSVQTIYSDQLSSTPGAVAQLREVTAQLTRFAKQTGTAIFLVGHVTKEGTLAGPRVLEHMVDTVLYFEGDGQQRFRALRAVKNRFGAVNELGIFAMTDKGLRTVNNPSAIFLNRAAHPSSGSACMATWEGSRPLLVEVQALVDTSHLQNPRRVTVGLEHNRLAMLLAVLHRHAGIASYDQDVFINVVGGVRVAETAADLAALSAIVSSLRNWVLPNDLLVFGEVGLSGEIRPVQNGMDRLNEAAKHGFTRAIVPQANCPKAPLGLEVLGVHNVGEALTALA